MLNFRIVITVLLFLSISNVYSQKTCITSEEKRLYDLVNEYRKENGLKKIPMSISLTIVAQAHVKDLQNSNPDKGNCNLHSWSGNGKWKSCCYTDDHAKATCMWNKPSELTNYTGYGFEIACQGLDEDKALSALSLWKTSSAHNAVIINEGMWKDSDWKAVGIGIFGDYAVIWFGREADADGEPSVCK